jgi:hypothetical protein
MIVQGIWFHRITLPSISQPGEDAGGKMTAQHNSSNILSLDNESMQLRNPRFNLDLLNELGKTTITCVIRHASSCFCNQPTDHAEIWTYGRDGPEAGGTDAGGSTTN